MLPLHEVETFLQHRPAHLQEIVLELRNLIAEAAPDAVEVVRWGGLSYSHEGCGGIVSAGICQIEIRNEQVRLSFIHGAFIADPRHMLMGNQKAKRSLQIESYESAPWDYCMELIRASAKLDPRSLSSPA